MRKDKIKKIELAISEAYRFIGKAVDWKTSAWIAWQRKVKKMRGKGVLR